MIDPKFESENNRSGDERVTAQPTKEQFYPDTFLTPNLTFRFFRAWFLRQNSEILAMFRADNLLEGSRNRLRTC